MFAVQSIERFSEMAVLAFGVFGAGAGSVQQAALDDVFGRRPGVHARVLATNAAITSAVGLVAPIVGVQIMARCGLRLALTASAAVCGLQLAVVMILCNETLPEGQRRSFVLARVEPLRNIAVLFRSGAALRHLALSHACFVLCAGAQQTMQSYQIGALGWTASDQSVWQTFQSLLGIVSQSTVVLPMLAWCPRRAFLHGSLFSAAGLVVLSQAWRPLGASKVRTCLQVRSHPT